MRRCCDALLQGDLFTAMADLTPEAVNAAMVLGSSIAERGALPESYTLESHIASSQF